MRSTPAEAPAPFLVPTDTVLLEANRLAPRRRRLAPPQLGLGPLALLLALAAALAFGQKYQLPSWATAVLAIFAGTLVVAWGPAWRAVKSRGGPTAKADPARLELLMIAEALLANERAGLLLLTEAADGLRADPLDATMPWPAEAIESTLLRRRSMLVARLVADWHGGAGDVMETLENMAVRRGVLHELATHRGRALVPTPGTQAALAKGLPAPQVETCPTDRPALWRSLTASIEEGMLAPPTPAPAQQSLVDPRADAGVDRFGIPSAPIPIAALRTSALAGAMLIVGPIAMVRFLAPDWDPMPALRWWGWAPLFAVAAAVGLFLKARRSWPDEPLPPPGGPGEEEAFAARRRRRLARPRLPPPLPVRLLTSVLMGALVYVLTTYITPIGVVVLALAFGFVSWSSRQWYRVQLLMPSAREVELAVARRSQELSAADVRASMNPFPEAPAARTSMGARARRQHWLEPDDLPPPTAAALALTDRRRQLARVAIRRHMFAFGLFVGGLTVVAITTILVGRTTIPELIVLGAMTWLFCLQDFPARLLQVVHAPRSETWAVAPGPIALLLRSLAALLPRAGTGSLAEAGRVLRWRMAEEPSFWSDETLNLAAPLGRSPRVLAIATGLLGIALLAAGRNTGNGTDEVAGAALLALAATYGWFLRQRNAPSTASAPVGVRLVLLRVFGSPSFDDLLELVRPWLLCGPVAHLEGYDSVGRSAEVREALALDRIDTVLVHSPEDLARRLAALPSGADDNGRYRRHSFQCSDAIWRTAIRSLLDRTDAVLMDLSDLGPEDMGCAYELGLLLDRVPLSRVLLLIDATTNLDCLQQVLGQAELQIAADSPNLDCPASAWRLLRIGGSSRRERDESYHTWLRRQDQRLAPLALVHFMLRDFKVPHSNEL